MTDETRRTEKRACVREALEALGVRRFACAIFDRTFPADPDEDTGIGTPASRASDRLLAFLAELGFDVLQLGPTGQTTRGNPSPYDGTVFSRTTLSLAPRELEETDVSFGGAGALVRPEEIAGTLAASAPSGGAGSDSTRIRYDAAFEATTTLARTAAERATAAPPWQEAIRAFRTREHAWLEADALYAAYADLFGDDPRAWPEEARSPSEVGRRTQAAAIDRHAAVQLLLHRQHERFRARARGHGLRLYADLQVGLSLADRWARAGLFLPGYAMGAPPSRTNPDGQPWGYPVLDPALYFEEAGGGQTRGPALRFVEARILKALSEFDGIRVDHPHGLVCPWVYKTDVPDAYAAVQTGARLFSSPSLKQHPTLARYAIVTPEQVDRARPRYADDWVRSLTPEQEARFAEQIDLLVGEARARGLGPDDVVCEVLSTMPYELGRVLTRHGLGRFRVTQKASLENPSDGYRAENARPEDWIMAGNHDTEPLFSVVERWHHTGTAEARAEYLATQLARDDARRSRLAAYFAASKEALAQGELALLFASPAAHVSVFVLDLFGETRWFNRPGTVHPDNWMLRLPADFDALYMRRVREHQALDVPFALALALRAREASADALVRRLEAFASRPLPV